MFWALTRTLLPLLLFWHCTLNLWSVWRSAWTMCMLISSPHYASCLCTSAFFAKRCRWRKSWGGVGEGGVGEGGMALYVFFYFLEGASCTHARMHAHARTHLCPPNLFRLEKLCRRHLHKNNWHFKLAFQSKRLLFCSICAGTEHRHTGEYERRAEESMDGRGRVITD